MGSSPIQCSTPPQWFALAVRPRHEKQVSRFLANKEYETFVPLHKKRHRYGPRTKEFELPLFPGYVFSRFDLQQSLRILVTPGVLQILGSGRTPTPVAEEEIAALQAVMNSGCDLQPYPFVQGDKVKITEGPLAGIEGTVVRFKDPLRLVLSITLLKRSVLVETDSDCYISDSPTANRVHSGAL
jgi:transcription antitermination factor NusG